jgi:hypothetical protein
MRAKLTAAAGLVALGAAAIPATAGAANVSVVDERLAYVAAAGERNAVRASVDRIANEMAIEEAVDVSVGPGCRPTATGAACSLRGVTAIAFDLGDADDRLDTSRLTADAVDTSVDRVIALGAGDDAMNARNGAFERVAAGVGLDLVDLDLVDPIAFDTEFVRSLPFGEAPGAAIASSRVRLTRRGVARVRLGCPAANARWCIGVLRLDRVSERPDGTIEPRSFVGESLYTVPRGAVRAVGVRLSRSARRQLARDGSWRTRAMTTEPGRLGPRTTIALITLVAP